jgi:hypothetical protein
VVISQSDKEKQACEESDNNNPDGRSGKKLEMKMFRTEKPGRTPGEDASTNRGCLGCVDLSHYEFHKSK